MLVQTSVEGRDVLSSPVHGVSRRGRRLRQLCMFIGSSFRICSLLDDLPIELRWRAVMDEVSEDDDKVVNNDDDDDGELKSSRAMTALQSLNHLVSSAKDDVEQRIRGVMTRTVDALSADLLCKTVALTSSCSIRTPWHDVRQVVSLVYSNKYISRFSNGGVI